MKYFKLTEEEQKLLDEVESGEWKSVDNIAEARKQASDVARNTLNKAKNINIRVSERDLSLLKRKAVEEGIPYQTLVSSILHKFAAK